MKKWMRNYGMPICLVLVIFFVILMNKGLFTGRHEDIKETEVVSAQEVPLDEVSYGMEIPYEYKADINEWNRIDAVIDVPDAVREEGFRKASAHVVDVPKASILALLEEFYHPYEGEEYDNIRQYLGEDEMYLSFFKMYQEFAMRCRAADYIGMAYRNQPTDDCNKDRYALEAELPDFPLADCDQRIQEVFQAYGMDSGLRIAHSTLDHGTMEQEALELHADGTWTKPDYAWSADDDSYYCRVWQLCNGIPVAHGYMLQSYGDILNQGTHTFVLNKERIIQMNMTEVYDIHYDNQGWEPLLGFEEVLGRYEQITEAAGETYAIRITDIGLRVIGVDKGGGRYRMAPIWIFYGTKVYEEEGVNMPFAMMLDAVTGDELWEL